MPEIKTEERYCSQHHQPRSECRSGDRHVWSLRVTDELMARVEAKAITMRLDRNAGAEMALEAWLEGSAGMSVIVASLRKRVTELETEAKLSERADRRRVSARERYARERGEATQPPAGAGEGDEAAKEEKSSTARTEPSAPVSAGAGPDLAATVAQLRREMDKLMAGNDEPMTRARQRAAVTAPGTVLFLEPGAEPVASFPVPENAGREQEGIAVTGYDAIVRAAAAGFSRDALWRDQPPLTGDCEHDLRCLPCIEYRQTVLCAKCGGLDTALSVAIAAAPSSFIIHEDGRIVRKFALKRRDSAEASERLRAMGMPEDIIAEIVPAE